MKLVFHFKSNGEVKYYGEKPQDCDLSYRTIDCSEEEVEKLKQNWHPFIENNKLILKKPAHIEKQEKGDLVAVIKAKADSITTVASAKEVIKDIFQLIKT